MKIKLTLFLFLFTCIVSAQKFTNFSASMINTINAMRFDESNNRYILGTYRGAPDFTNKLSNSQENQVYLAKLNSVNEVIWAQPIISDDMRRWDLILQNNKIYIVSWYNKSDYNANKHNRALYLETYSINGVRESQQEIIAVENGKVDFKSYLTESGIIIQTTFKGDDNQLKLNGKTYNKTKYSTVIFWKLDYSGKQIWEYQIEGGLDGFTDIRINDVISDKDGNTYIGSYYSAEVDLGIAAFTTKMAFKGKPALYDYGTFLLKIDKDGKAVKAISLADNYFYLEKLEVDDLQRIYIAAYYKGSDSYEKKFPSEGNNKSAKLLGTALPDTRSGEGVTPPTEDLVLVALDKDFNLRWTQCAPSYANSRSRSISIINNQLHVCATGSKTTFVGDQVLALDEDGYMSAFYYTIDSVGKPGLVTTFIAKESNMCSMFADNSGNIIITGTHRHPIKIGTLTYPVKATSSGCFIYDLNDKISPSTITQPITSPSAFNVGDRIYGNWKGQGKYYPGKIAKMEGIKVYIQYDDGDVEWTTIDFLRKAN